mmetsp:Transcript_32439/g.80320  ORF Transcript_32439/g.80320 Transcript_32439/m.80320 type:complete len:254 (+) Transcript_32439:658-1419(+)
MRGAGRPMLARTGSAWAWAWAWVRRVRSWRGGTWSRSTNSRHKWRNKRKPSGLCVHLRLTRTENVQSWRNFSSSASMRCVARYPAADTGPVSTTRSCCRSPSTAPPAKRGLPQTRTSRPDLKRRGPSLWTASPRLTAVRQSNSSSHRKQSWCTCTRRCSPTVRQGCPWAPPRTAAGETASTRSAAATVARPRRLEGCITQPRARQTPRGPLPASSCRPLWPTVSRLPAPRTMALVCEGVVCTFVCVCVMDGCM